MLLPIRKKVKYISALSIVLLLINSQPAHAAGDTGSSLFSNPVAVCLLSLMILLLIIIAILGNILLGTADIKVRKDKKSKVIQKVLAAAIILFLLSGNSLLAQSAGADASAAGTSTSMIAGMSPFVFYLIISVVFLELLVILVLLVNIRALLKTEKEKLAGEAEFQAVKKSTITWWSRFNKFKPVEQEADIDLGHDYDGIRELDNRLPPWWIYGFYITIIVAGIYLWRFHVSHTGPSAIEEYNQSVASADLEIKEYLKKKGDAVDENTVAVLSSPDDLATGKKIFLTSCVTCHKETGAGDVGPNLTDDYWLHGGDIKNIFKTIRYGINAMPQWQNSYSNKQIAQVASYVKSLKGTNPPNPKAAQGELYKEVTSPVKATADSAATKENKVAANK